MSYHLLLAISAIGLAVAVGAFVKNVAPRDKIDKCLGESLPVPERRVLEGYDCSYLKRVASHLESHRLDEQQTLLDMYIRPVLLWNDIVFAIALSISSASFWVWIIIHFGLSGLPRDLLLLLFTACAVLYGILDVAEDLTLVSLLRAPGTISKRDGQVSSLLTRLKFYTIIISITGAIVFQALSSATHRRPAHG
ncbi:hypothetical protein [Bradyrhizobium sp. 170]|uniref:hypothetical protein n=1 Tax=Bradyrhizobium sp. 170 TaxID=2782641 RepID=UPI001FFF4418|nr:hypothetical protein [Bradyrhizobium sp. 170]UPK01812.1 hypothetical protein IVB05_29810 [Bradyrhizobium sp. 170]